MPTQAKTDSVEALKERLGGAKTAVLTEYRGLSVQQLSDLRKQLKGAAAEYKVVKNRLARIAVKGSPLDFTQPLSVRSVITMIPRPSAPRAGLITKSLCFSSCRSERISKLWRILK